MSTTLTGTAAPLVIVPADSAPSAPQTPKLLLKVSEVQQALGLSRSTVYALMDRREIKAVKIGAAVRVPVSELNAFIARQMAASAA